MDATNIRTELQTELKHLQKKYPAQRWRALLIDDSQLNFTLTMRGYVGSLLIESNRYEGIAYVTTQLMIGKGSLIGVIVDLDKFETTTNRAMSLINTYGI